MHGVYRTVYGTVHHKKPLKTSEVRVGHSPGFGLPSDSLLPQCAESDVKQNFNINIEVSWIASDLHIKSL